MELKRVSLVILLLVQASMAVHGRHLPLIIPKPDPKDGVATARWLASQNIWGVLSTISSQLGGAPFGNVVSFSDGLPDNGHGVPYFYLTTLDPTAQNALKDQRSSFAISEYSLGTCGKNDPENPTCAKLTLTGKLKLVEGNSKETKFAESALFSKHAEMKGWPKSHNFQFFRLDIEDIFLIDEFGGPKPITLDQYLHPKMDELDSVIKEAPSGAWSYWWWCLFCEKKLVNIPLMEVRGWSILQERFGVLPNLRSNH